MNLLLTKDQIRDQAIDILKTIYDPEIPVNIYELGLIYEVEINDDDEVIVTMTLTAPNCPVAGSLPMEVENKLRGLPGISDARVDITWEPPWEMSKMSEEAKLQLGLL
ncbi:MAG: SUF system Fe-S cluster assembly protein [Ignavibacteriae bacterium]|nr:SUF system Fe-S cluster assembly protein [Ignavibacteriota bacterium]MCB9217370.1 SUF system Fe-S cluster assembly protein [Ignavibacteria bacterium]